MKNKVIDLKDKILFRKRSIIDTVNNRLKNISQIEHAGDLSVHNFTANLPSGLIAYASQPKRTKISGIYDKLLSQC